MSQSAKDLLAVFQFEGLRVPTYMHDGLLAYLESGRRPGHFLTAVLEGDLYEAFGRADCENKASIAAYVAFLYNHADARSYGSKEKVQAWIDTRCSMRQSAPGQQQEKTSHGKQ